ncbi:MAG TPA: XdhC family protein [Candidatus Limnocylindrales bacterium]|nr:XdhC family protein [Candidatus Limnocylindrales bacterium]
MAAGHSLFPRAAELASGGRPFVLATVVAVRRPTSARPGATGIVHPDGTIEGWVGGSCAQPVVVREALRALADGQPRLLRLSKDGPGEGRRADGVVELVMTCHSGGTLEIYVEPHLPAPHLWVAGTTPIAGALVALGAASGWRVTLFDPVADAEAFPAAEAVLGDRDLHVLEFAVPPSVVVATQGVWDEEAVLAALRRDVAYVGLVASPTRAAVVRQWLRDETGLAEDRIAALRAPAGLDLGAETAEEVALSILAELVQVRRGRAAFVAAPGPATIAGRDAGAARAADDATAPIVDDIVLIDPVCGMTVDRKDARHLAEYGGTVYAFCQMSCRTRFIHDPAAFAPAASAPAAPAPAASVDAASRRAPVSSEPASHEA